MSGDLAPWRSWPVTLSAGLALSGASLSLSAVLVGSSWAPPIITCIALMCATLILIRAVTRSAWLPYAVAVVVLAGGVNALFLGEKSILGLIPTPQTWAGYFDLFGEAANTIIHEYTPAPARNGIVFFACLAFGILLLLADWIALRAGAAAVGLLLIAVFIIPAMLSFTSVSGWSFCITAFGYVLLLATGRAWHLSISGSSPGGTTPGTRNSVKTLAIALVGVLVAALLPQVIPGFREGLFPQGSRINAFMGRGSGVNPLLTLNANLQQRGGAQIQYSTNARQIPYLGLISIDDFSKERWEPSDRKSFLRVGVDSLAPSVPPFIPAQSTAPLMDTTIIRTGEFTSPYLPVPMNPTEVTGTKGRWAYDPEDLSIHAQDETSSVDQFYQVTSLAQAPTLEELRNAPAAPVSVGTRYLDLPREVPQIIRKTANDVTAGESTAYDKAVSLQNYLRGSDFTYSLTAPAEKGYDGTGMNVLAQFLSARSGYCVHFSSAMAVMARTLGIPSRVVVGFAPGHSTGKSKTQEDGRVMVDYTVDGTDAHAWPELFFEGYGWVRFEPTPTRGYIPAYALTPGSGDAGAQGPDENNQSRPDPLPSVSSAPIPSAVATPTPTSAPVAVGSRDGAFPDLTPVLMPVLITLGALLLLAAPALIRLLRRRRRLDPSAPLAAQSLGAMEEVRDLARDYGHVVSDRDSARGVAAVLMPVLDATGRKALNTLVNSYELARYGPAVLTPAAGTSRSTHTTPEESPSGVLTDAVEQVRSGLASSASQLSRVRAVALPPSLFSRS